LVVKNGADSLAEIKQVDAQLGELLEAVNAAVGDALGLSHRLISYPYGSKVMHEGVMLDVLESDLPDDFLISGAAPLAIVTRGALDVIDGTQLPNGRSAAPPISIAQLYPGDLLGVFETLDFYENIDHRSAADWTIYSGINSQHPTVEIGTSTRFRKISRAHNSSIAFNDFEKIPLLGQRVRQFSGSIPDIQKWKVNLVLLNKAWTDLIFTDDSDTSLQLEIMKIRSIIHRKAWQAVTNSRNINSNSKKYIYSKQSGDNANRQRVNRAFRLFESVVDIALGRKPVFAPCPKTSDSAPNRHICEKFLAPAGISCGIMQPQFLSADLRSGFIPFVYLLPELVANANARSDSLDTLREAFSKIIDASSELAETAGDETRAIPLLRKFPELISCISVQKSGEAGVKNFYHFDVSEGVSLRKISEAEFLGNLPHDGFKQWKYFSHCLKIDLDLCSW